MTDISEEDAKRPPGTFSDSELEVTPEQADEIRKELVKSLRRRKALEDIGWVLEGGFPPGTFETTGE